VAAPVVRPAGIARLRGGAGDKTVQSVADEPQLAPGVAGVGVTYDFALREDGRGGRQGPQAPA